MSGRDLRSALTDPNRPATVHVVGIGGAGMSAIATALDALGHTVTGSDLRPSGVIDRLRQGGIPVVVGHAGDNVGDADVVTVSSAIAEDNPEVVEAGRRGIPVLARSETLAAIASLRRCIAVAGTHGKTTTASMLALVLVEAGMRPSFLIGGDVNEIGTNAVWDRGEWLVVEADESDGTFLFLGPEVAVVTNVEPDHLDHYGSFDALGDRLRPVRRSGIGTAGGRGRRGHRGGDRPGGGRRPGGDVGRLHPPHGRPRAGPQLGLVRRSSDRGRGPARPPRRARPRHPQRPQRGGGGGGRHGRRRHLRRRRPGRWPASPGWPGASSSGAPPAGSPSSTTTPTCRARSGTPWPPPGTGGGRRVVAVFQPHRYSRTAELGPAFGPAFGDADVVVVTDVYGAGEAPVPGVSGRLVADAVRAARPDRPVVLRARPAPGSARRSPGCSVRATCAARSAPATSPPCPTSSCPTRRGEGDGGATGSPDLSRLARVLGDRAVAGRAARRPDDLPGRRSRRPRRRAGRRGGAGGAGPPAGRSRGARAGARPRLEPAGGRRRVRRVGRLAGGRLRLGRRRGAPGPGRRRRGPPRPGPAHGGGRARRARVGRRGAGLGRGRRRA